MEDKFEKEDPDFIEDLGDIGDMSPVDRAEEILKDLKTYINNIDVALLDEYANLNKVEARIEMIENERKNLIELVAKYEI